MKKTAKERKLAAKAKSKEAVKKASRRSGRVVSYVSAKAKQPKRRKTQIEAFTPKMGKPKGLSPRARFDMLRPDCIHPWDWWQLFSEDESIWEAIASEAIEAVRDGEMREYPEDGIANVSRRKLRKLSGGL